VVTSLRSALSAVFRALPVHMAAADFTGTDARVRQTFPANFAAFALNGLFFPTAGKILAAGLLLTWFVSTLTPAAFWVGLIIPIQYGFALVAQPLIGAWLAGRRRRVWYYAAQALLRGGLWALLALAAWRLGADRPALLLAIFFGVVVLDAVAAGVGNIALNDALARVIPKPLRGRARSWRGIFGGVTAGAAGILIAILFSERSGMAAYALLFAASGVLYALGGLTIGLIDDPQEGASGARQPTTRAIRSQIGTLWRDDAFRWFVLTQALLVPLVQGLPFFALLGRRVFNLELDALGPLLIISAVTPIVANAAWGWLADNRGNRWALAAAAALGLLAPILGGILLMAPSDRTAALVLLGGIVFAIGAASTGVDLTTKNIVLDLAPSAAERPLTIGVNDTLIGIPTALLVGAGAIIDLVGFAPIYVGIGALTLLGVVLAGRLPTAAHQAAAVA
jgi:hypothetical protein